MDWTFTSLDCLTAKNSKTAKPSFVKIGVNTNKYIKPLKKYSSQVPNNDYLIFKEQKQTNKLTNSAGQVKAFLSIAIIFFFVCSKKSKKAFKISSFNLF